MNSYPPLKSLNFLCGVVILAGYNSSRVPHRDKTFFEKDLAKRQTVGFVMCTTHLSPAALVSGARLIFLDGVLKGHQQLPCRVSAWLHNRTKLWRVKIAAHLFCLHVQETGSTVANKVGWHKGEVESKPARFYLLLNGEHGGGGVGRVCRYPLHHSKTILFVHHQYLSRAVFAAVLS